MNWTIELSVSFRQLENLAGYQYYINYTRAWALSPMSRIDSKTNSVKKVLGVENFDNEKSKFLFKI